MKIHCRLVFVLGLALLAGYAKAATANNLDTRLNEAVTLIAEGKSEQAVRLLDALVVLYPDDPRLGKLLVLAKSQTSNAATIEAALPKRVNGTTMETAKVTAERRENEARAKQAATEEALVGYALKQDLVRIEPGTFLMGSKNGDVNEQPVTRVTLTQPFWLGKHEVTQRLWREVMDGNPSNFEGENLPVENVSWLEAVAFCAKLTQRERGEGRLPEGYAYRLPTEAEWEYACRAGTTDEYAGPLPAMAWFSDNSGSTTHPVGEKRANAWGLYDMHGNVWEWCADWKDSYPGGSVTDPTGPSSGSYRVVRGGSWHFDAPGCRSAYRLGISPGARYLHGFRLALSSVR